MPRVSPERLAATRRQILDGARLAFARHGYEGATVRLLEQSTGLSRGAIFHHFADKDALFLELARDDAEEMAAVVAEHGLVQVMRDLRTRDAGWLGVQLEVSRRLRTDPRFRRRWEKHLRTVAAATRTRLIRQRAAGIVRPDVPVHVLVNFLSLVHDGLVAHLAAGLSPQQLDSVLDLVEDTVRTRPTERKRNPA
ncbi:MAG TPA: helix-turn-helix domain-containing protein [Mycobacteriales bacterium]|nr:helix-turn-helix domain-containing protein [Mycobacteriales bacterium]